MADEVKVVEYQLVGDTSGLVDAINSTLAQLDQIQTKLNAAYTTATTGKATTTDILKVKSLISAQASITRIQASLANINLSNLTTEQADHIEAISTAVDLLDKNLGKLSDKYDVSKSQINAANSALGSYASSLEKVNKATNKVNKTTKSTTKSTETLNNSVKKATVLGMSWAYVLQKIAEWLYEGYKDAQSYAETMNLFNVAAGESSEKLGELAENMEKVFHGNIQEYLQQIAIFKQYANTIGLATEKSEIFSEALTKLGADLASLYNTTNETAYSALLSGLAGNTKTLMNQFGISVHKSTLEMELLNLGIDRTYSSLNNTEKVVLRYIAIMRQASAAQGDLAKTLESPENQFKILTAQLKVLMRNLGSFVVIIAKTALPIINGFAIALNTAIEAMAKAAGYEIEDYSDSLNATTEGLEDIENAAEDTEDALTGTLAPLDEINEATTSDNDSYGDVDQRLLDALEEYDNLMDSVYTKTDAVAAIFEKVWNIDFFEGLGSVLDSVFNLFAQGLDIVLNALDAVSPALNVVLTILGYILDAASWLISNIVSPVVSFISTLIDNIWLLIAAFVALNLVQLAFTGELNSMMAVQIAKWFASLTVQIWENVAAHLANVAAAVKEKIAAAALTIAIWWETAAWWQKAIAVIAAAGALALVVAGIVMTATAATVSTAKSTTSTNLIPAMATGGVATGPTVALIGEGDYQEAVVPLGNSPQFKSMKDDIASSVVESLAQTPAFRNLAGSSGAAGGTTPVVLQIDGRTLARTTLPYIGYTQSQTGVKLK